MRQRRRENISDESTESTETYIDSKDPYRMGGPGVLPRYPVDETVSPHAVHPHFQDLIDYAIQTCSSRSISCQATIITRYNRGSCPKIPEDHTLMIVADRSTNRDDSWVVVIKDIIKRLTKIYFSGRVEIFDPSAYYGRRAFPIAHDHELVNRWDSLRPRLLAALAGTDWAMMVPLLLGYNEADARPTLTITAENPQSDAWKDTMKLLHDELNNPLVEEIDLELNDCSCLWGVYAGAANAQSAHFGILPKIPNEVWDDQAQT